MRQLICQNEYTTQIFVYLNSDTFVFDA